MDRNTRQKRAIEKVLAGNANPMTAAEIHAHASGEVPGVGLATVYRNLKSLAESGRVVIVEIPGQPPRYERADKGHHHHFLCRACGGVFELTRCIDGIRALAPDEFLVEDHEIILYGSCRQCASSSRKARRSSVRTPGRVAKGRKHRAG